MQTTLRHSIQMHGTGLHTGRSCVLQLSPLGPYSGLQMLRSDVDGARPFKVSPDRVSDTRRCTCLVGDAGELIKTVEHLLAAITHSGLDNVLVTLDSEEVPIGDGSALAYLELISETGLESQGVAAEVFVVDKPYYVHQDDRLVAAFPYDGLRITAIFSDEHGILGTQAVDMDVDESAFRLGLAPARTIGFMREIEALKAQGLALGASMDLAVVIGSQGYINEPRFYDEPVRHKALDLLGDLAVLGRLKGHLISIKGGHALNNALARSISSSSQ